MLAKATVPEYEKYNKYIIESQDTATSGKEDEFLNSKKQVYI